MNSSGKEKSEIKKLCATLTHEPTDDESSMQPQPMDPINSERLLDRVSEATAVNDDADVIIGCDCPLRMD